MPDNHWRNGALAGALTSTAAAGLLYLLSALGYTAFVPLDIANTIIEYTPGSVATTTIETIGEWGKRLLVIGGVVGFVIAWAVLGGLFARFVHHRPLVSARLRLFMAVGLGLVALAPTLAIQYLIPANFASLPAGVVAPLILAITYLLVGVGITEIVARLATSTASGDTTGAPGRRAFLLGSGGTLVSVALGSTALAELLPESRPAGVGALLPTSVPSTPQPPTVTSMPSPTSVPEPTAVTTPTGAAVVSQPGTPQAPSPVPATPTTAAPPTPTELPAFVAAPGTRPEITPQESLYVISSSTRDPVVDVAAWRLKIHGAVQNPFSLTYEELLALPRHDQTSTMECISNEVGNLLIGNCNWNGILLRDILERAVVEDGVVDIVFRAAEGYSESVPLARALDPATIIAYGIDGMALETKHGFPARVRIPNLYGEKNVKWLTEVEAVRSDYQGYWQQRGWSDDATIVTTSVFDTGNPHLGNGQLTRQDGVVALGGIAFAGERGIRIVEVQIDDGAWVEARLKESSSAIAWRFWRYDWPAEAGKHQLQVRAVDGQGEMQTAEIRDTHPDGATGYHRIEVEVV